MHVYSLPVILTFVHISCSSYSLYHFSPYKERCKNLHDPRVEDSTSTDIVLEHKYKRAGRYVIPDRLFHRETSDVHRTNPIISKSIWETHHPTGLSYDGTSSDFQATYNLVVNASSNLFVPAGEHRTGSGLVSNQDITNGSCSTHIKLGEIQKHCIVLKIREMDETHRDFTYAPTDCKFVNSVE